MVENSDIRVVVIDADSHIRRLIRTLLGALAIQDVLEARSATHAAALMIDRSPDLVIADWTGEPTELLLFVHRLRRGELGDKTIPVLAMATTTHHAVLERAWESGIDDVIAKPVSAMEVIRRSAKLLEERRRAEWLNEAAE